MKIAEVLVAVGARSSAFGAIGAERDRHAAWFSGRVKSAYDAYYDRPRQFPYEPEKVAEIEAIEATVGTHAQRIEELKGQAYTAHVAALAAVGEYAGAIAVTAIEADEVAPAHVAILDAMREAARLRRDHIDGRSHSLVLNEPGPLTMAFVKALLAGQKVKPTKANQRSMADALRQPLFITAPIGTEALMERHPGLEDWIGCDDSDGNACAIARGILGDSLVEALSVLGRKGVEFTLTAVNPHLRLHSLPTELEEFTDAELRGAVSRQAWLQGTGHDVRASGGWSLKGLREALREREGRVIPRP